MKYIYSLLCYIVLSSASFAQEGKTGGFESQFTVDKAALSTEKTEFGAVLSNDNTVYYSRANANLNPNDNSKSDLDIYQATLNKDLSFSEITGLTSINSKWHDGTATVSSDGNTMYFASESFNTKKGFEKEKTPSKIYKNGKIYLFKATKVNGEWTSATPLPFNSPTYSVRNPSLSEDGKTLYFSSNMPGGLGGEDIWKVTIDGTFYGAPENLGVTVNSKSNESFPFISSKNVLYFSSNRAAGLGGLDVYRVDFNKNKGIENLGAPVNSEKDDFSFSLNEAKKTGFFSSNRAESDDIYLVTPICNLMANIIVLDKESKQVIADAKLDILNDDEIIKTIMTTAIPYTSKLQCEKPFYLKATKEGYEDATQTITPSNEGGDLQVVVEMSPLAPIVTETEVILQEIYFVFEKSNITAQGKTELDKLVEVMNTYPEMQILVKSHTDTIGNNAYNLDLSNRRANSTVAYVVSKGIAKERITGKGLGETEPKINCDPCTIEQNKQNRRSEFMIIK
jgi:outer membrane protein OmpA-like peptidoglycan-associated protein